MAKEKDMDMHKAMMEDLIKQRFKRPFWDQVKDAIGVVIFGVLILSTFIVIATMIFMLIENPVSLAILCLTIFLILAWSSR